MIRQAILRQAQDTSSKDTERSQSAGYPLKSLRANGASRLRFLACGVWLLAGSSFLFPGKAFAGEGYTWRVTDMAYEVKAGKAYKGINEGLSWVKEIFVSPGGWNGSADYRRFDNSGLQRYRVIGRKDIGKFAGNEITFHTGDLVFPDGSVWRRSEGYRKGYYAGSIAWELATDNSGIDDCENKDRQYEYAKNLPSALAIADAWDGVKNLISGVAGTHWKEDGYYRDNAISWYRDIGNGRGKSRLPRIDEYKKAGEGQLNLEDNLLYGSRNYPRYQWSSEQDNGVDGVYRYSIHTYSVGSSKEGRELVSYPLGGCWVVEK